jgi:hypothetical protein
MKVAERREFLIRAGRAVIRARLRDTRTAAVFWAHLPIYSTAETWGGALRFETEIETGLEARAKATLKSGEIGYHVESDRVYLAFGPTPITKPGGSWLMPSPLNVFADALDDVAGLAVARAGERVAVLHADS